MLRGRSAGKSERRQVRLQPAGCELRAQDAAAAQDGHDLVERSVQRHGVQVAREDETVVVGVVYWYLLLAEGGTERGHVVTAARGPHPWGPFEPCPSNPIFTHRSLGHPVQSTGHADLVLGRETFLAGITWVDGWPLFDEERYQVPVPDTDFVDDFSTREFDHRWVTPYSEPETIAQHADPSGLVFAPTTDERIGLLCTRVRDHHWAAQVVVQHSGRFLLRLDDRHWYGLKPEGGTVRAEAQIGDLRQELRAHPVTQPPTGHAHRKRAPALGAGRARQRA